MEATVIILLIILISISIWNHRSLRDIKKLTVERSSGLPDARYYELKYNIQLLTGLSTVLIAIIGFLGYSNLDSAKSEMKADFKKSVDSLEYKLNTINNRLDGFNSSADKIEGSFSRADLLEAKINGINNKNILKQSYYIVTGLSFKTKGSEDVSTLYFKNFRTNSGDRLPSFKNPPIIIAVPDVDTPVITFDVTNESFSIVPYGVQVKDRNAFDGEPILFILLIFEK